MKKYPYDSEETGKVLINKMLEKHKVDVEYVKANPTIEGIPWYQYYTFTEEEHQQWKDFFINYVMKECKPKQNKKDAEKKFMWFDMMWGLKIQY